MKKDLHKFIDHMRNKLPKWMNFQNLIFFLVILAFIIILWGDPLSYFFKGEQSVDAASTAAPTMLPDILTSLPEEWIRSDKQTNGVILGAIIIILTVVAGTAVILIRDRD
jgi:Ca2+/Na+ antiporter